MTLMASKVSIVDFEQVFLLGSSLTNEYTEQKLRILIKSIHGAITSLSRIRYGPKKNMKRIKLTNKFLKEHTKRNTKLNLQLKNYCVWLFRRCKREFYTSLHKKKTTDNKVLEICKTILARNTARINFFPNVVTNLNISKIDKHWHVLFKKESARAIYTLCLNGGLHWNKTPS